MPSSTINWPDTLACTILQDGFELKPVSPLLRTSLNSGRAIQRRKYLSTPMTATIKFLFTEKQYLFFDAWFTGVLLDGVNWFNMPLKTSTGYHNYLCRFTDIYESATPTQGRFWQVSAEVELYKRPVFDQNTSDYAAYTPNILSNLDIFDIAINREWPQV